jgi:hypothetical protein
MSRHKEGRDWQDDGPQSPYTPHVTVGATALVNGVPLHRSPDIRKFGVGDRWHAETAAAYRRRERHGL